MLLGRSERWRAWRPSRSFPCRSRGAVGGDRRRSAGVRHVQRRRSGLARLSDTRLRPASRTQRAQGVVGVPPAPPCGRADRRPAQPIAAVRDASRSVIREATAPAAGNLWPWIWRPHGDWASCRFLFDGFSVGSDACGRPLRSLPDSACGSDVSISADRQTDSADSTSPLRRLVATAVSAIWWAVGAAVLCAFLLDDWWTALAPSSGSRRVLVGVGVVAGFVGGCVGWRRSRIGVWPQVWRGSVIFSAVYPLAFLIGNLLHDEEPTSLDSLIRWLLVAIGFGSVALLCAGQKTGGGRAFRRTAVGWLVIVAVGMPFYGVGLIFLPLAFSYMVAATHRGSSAVSLHA